MQIKNLDKFYGPIKAVNDVSFDIPRGKVTALIGPNGAGKSTVLHIITRLIKRDGGTVTLDGKEMLDYKSAELAKKMSILTQNNNMTMKLTVEELVAFGRFPHSGTKLNEEDKKIIADSIAYMELEEFTNSFIDEMSGGQQQRAFIAMVLAQDTDIVFLDEPTNNLDIYHSLSMMNLLRKLCDELGKTVVVVLHDINFASRYCDYIGAFFEGGLYMFDTVDKVMTKENLKNLYRVDFDVQQVDGKPIALYY